MFVARRYNILAGKRVAPGIIMGQIILYLRGMIN